MTGLLPAQIPIAQSDEYLPQISQWSRLGAWLLVGTLFASVGVAATVRYKLRVKAPAVARPIGELRVVQSSLEGVVERIMVTENQVVTPGQVIAVLENTRLQTQSRQLQTNIRRSQQQLSQIQAQIQALSSRRHAEQAVTQRAVAAAAAELTRTQRQFQEQQTTTQADVAEAQAALDLAQDQFNRFQLLVSSGAISAAQLQEKASELKAAMARLQRVKAALNPLDSAIHAAQAKMQEEQARGNSTLASLQQELESLVQQQVNLQSQLERDQKEWQQLQTELQKHLVRAPIQGRVVGLSLRNRGQFLAVGETLTQIAPQPTPLVFQAQVAVQDITLVRSGQPVQLRISSYPYPDYGVLEGTVDAIAADVSPVNASSTAPYYRVTIRTKAPYLVRNQQRYFLQSGMEAEADITAHQETFLQFLLRRMRLQTGV
jgi:HlyD family type I secretion membrane fusion protein